MYPPTDINHVFAPDLFTYIFDFLYESTNLVPKTLEITSEEEAADLFGNHPLLNVMLVCRAWYNLIKVTSKYWTQIAIGLDGRIGWGRKAEEIPEELLAGTLDEVLRRSGRLPIEVTAVPKRFQDLQIVAKALQKDAPRLASLTLLPCDDRRKENGPAPHEHIKDLLECTFPTLEQLIVGPLRITSLAKLDSVDYTFTLAAPNLRRLACDTHFIIPHPAFSLIHLSLTNLNPAALHPPLPSDPVEFPQLLELCLSFCDPGEILPILSTPELQTLIVHNHWPGGGLRRTVPRYPNLRELQWSDVGPDECFKQLTELSPNLIRYSNYAFGKVELDLEGMDEPASIFGIISSDVEAQSMYPKLKEVCLDIASCAEIEQLITAIPSIELLRVLRDPSKHGNEDERAREAKMLVELMRKVDLRMGWGRWRGNLG